MFGVLRSDRVLLPFAAFDGDDWSTPWPAAIGPGRPGAPEELPLNLAAIPDDWWGGEEPGGWRLWPRDAGAGVMFKLVAPVVMRIGTERRLGVRTDYPAQTKPLVPPYEVPYPKEGLAVAGNVVIGAIPTVSLLAPSAQKLVGRIRPEIEEAEERAISAIRSETGWSHPLDRPLRRKFFPVIEALYSTALAEAGSAVSYVEIVKKYPPLPEDKGCGLESFITGWVHQTAEDVRLRTELKAVVTYCDRENASYMLPLGFVTLRNRTHWIFQMSGQDHEWYVVAELTPGRARYRAEYYAGGIPR